MTNSEFPIKKIYYKMDGSIEIDQKGLEEYSSKTTTKTKELQEWLSMPLNTSDSKRLNLPDYSTGSSSNKPYIEVLGTLKKTKSGSTITLLIRLNSKKDSKHVTHEMDLETGKITYQDTEPDKALKLRLDDKKYFVGSNTIFEEYVKSGIVDEKKELNLDKYDKIANKFLTVAYKSKPDNLRPNKVSFRVYILPNDKPVEYKELTKSVQTNNTFTDCFGNETKSYASSRTINAKFITFDDPAFTINCKQGNMFYENLGIGNESHERVNINSSKMFKIAGLDWMFLDIMKPEETFDADGSGILAKLYAAHRKLVSKSTVSKKPSLKIICIKPTQAKQEIFIDENITTDRLDAIFSSLKKGDVSIPHSCIEDVFIYKSGQATLWNTYLHVVRSLIAGNQIPRSDVMSYLTKILRTKDLRDSEEMCNFFQRSEFYIKHLLQTSPISQDVSREDWEMFATRAGQIARLYVDFKKDGKEGSNSLNDILTYPRYDRVRLRFVLQRVQLGIQLSKITEGKDDLISRVDRLRPDAEISDEHASDDLSYFFFKGYHTPNEMEGATP